jgi:hypothetical protein
MFRLGVCYAEGTGVAASMAMAEDWICKAAKLEERFSAVAEALKDMDRPESMLDHPEQVAAVLQDYAEEGSNLCRWLLQSFYRHGLGVPQDSAAAEALLLQAAQEGFVPAMRTLAVTRQHGYGVEQDTQMALYWYDRAVEAGDAESMRMLAHWYTDGVDGVPNPDLAVKLYEQAVALGLDTPILLADNYKTARALFPSLTELQVPAALANVAIGQGGLMATPLHVAQITAAVYNGGLLPSATVVEGYMNADGNITVEENTPPTR